LVVSGGKLFPDRIFGVPHAGGAAAGVAIGPPALDAAATGAAVLDVESDMHDTIADITSAEVVDTMRSKLTPRVVGFLFCRIIFFALQTRAQIHSPPTSVESNFLTFCRTQRKVTKHELRRRTMD
jgi:hypothetical protein